LSDEVKSFEILVIFNGVSFITYGFLCLNSSFLKKEFRRWGVEKFRVLTGCLEILGGFAQILSFWHPILGLLSSVGLFF
jgi:hypothetical protein